MVNKIVIRTQFYYNDKKTIPQKDIVAALAMLQDDKKNIKLVDKLLKQVRNGILTELKQIKEQLKENVNK